MRRFIDIGANLCDGMYSGCYHGSVKHVPDLKSVTERAFNNGGLKKIIITGGNLQESKNAVEMSKTDDRLFCTVGVHPTRCNELEENTEQYLHDLSDLISTNRSKVAALGEFGLDYDRLEFCSKDIQKKNFEVQLKELLRHDLPLFLHCRGSGACDDLINLLKQNTPSKGGVVHSFDGSLEEAHQILSLSENYFIGINGCSLKTEDNLKVVKEIPNDRIMLETDCPWCEIRPSHAGYKHIKTKFTEQFPTVKKDKFKEGALIKSRNEPIFITQVLEVIAAVKNVCPDELSEIIFKNTDNMFFPEKD